MTTPTLCQKYGPKQLGKSLKRLEDQLQLPVRNYVNPDPVKSFIRADRCGPNPNPEWCYLQKTNACQNTYGIKCQQKK